MADMTQCRFGNLPSRDCFKVMASGACYWPTRCLVICAVTDHQRQAWEEIKNSQSDRGAE
jgi:hypothetical protein